MALIFYSILLCIEGKYNSLISLGIDYKLACMHNVLLDCTCQLIDKCNDTRELIQEKQIDRQIKGLVVRYANRSIDR